MRRITFMLLGAMLCPLYALSSGQAAERLVMGRDTLQLFYLPLNDADAEVRQRLAARIAESGSEGGTGCWRNYIGWWRLDEEGVLWLERVETEEGEPLMTGAELLPEEAFGERARASWVTGEMRCGGGPSVYYQHDGFCRHTEREWILTLREGRVTARRAYRNRAFEVGADMRENVRRLAAAYDTARLGALPRALMFFVRFAADSTGRAVRVDRAYLTAYDADARADSRRIDDMADPLLAEALRAFRAETRWNAWWIDGGWKEQWYSFPLRRNGRPWVPRSDR